MQCAILFAPVEALYLVLYQILVVLCEVLKHHNLVLTKRFLLWFHVPCLGFHQVQVLIKVADAVDEEFLVFLECCCKCSQCSTICCLPLTIMEFRAHIQMKSSSRYFFKAALPRHDSMMHHTTPCYLGHR